MDTRALTEWPEKASKVASAAPGRKVWISLAIHADDVEVCLQEDSAYTSSPVVRSRTIDGAIAKFEEKYGQ